ncbi:MAG: HAD family phosphatase, partial [Victivallales bacterium]|nr:HAD family phosphatase [Victivallales bacterium]
MNKLLEGKRACLFDMDGTLIDSESIWQEAIRMALRKKGILLSMEEVACLEYGRAWNEIFDEIHSRWPEAYATRMDMEAFTVPYYKRIAASRNISIPGSVEALRQLH